MKIFNSIKWRLQIWYGFYLAIAFMGFVGVSYQLESARQYNNIDRELGNHIEQIIDFMKRPPPPGDPNQPPPDDQPPDHPFRRDHERDGLHLPPRTFGTYFDFAGPKGFYFVIWSSDGEELMCSTNAPSGLSMPMDHSWTRTRGVLRESFDPIPGPRPDYVILVGRSIAPELKELHQALLKQIAWGLWMLSMGLFVGWFISSRVLRPISEISAAAAKISGGDLSQRINIAETESELGQLAAVLNTTFARLDAAFARQQQFTADAAHELRTPVSVILTQTQSTLNKERPAGEYRETLEACQRAAQRMRRLIAALLELARLDAGQKTVPCEAVDLARTAAEGAELLRPLADERRITLQTDLTPATGLGNGDQLALVITNLLANAIQHNHDGGAVRLATRIESGVAILSVSDNGPGVPAEHLPHLFERFYRADPARSSQTGGAGLGLAIVKSCVDACGGTVACRNLAPNGFEVEVRLEAVTATPA